MEMTLCIERADGTWALYGDGDTLAAGRIGQSTPRSPEWFRDVVVAVAAAGFDMRNADAFLCGIGPGSFSGIRATLAAFQGLAMPRRLPVLGVSSAAALARREALARGVTTVTVVGDARRGLLWLSAYDVSAAGDVSMLASGAAPTHTSADFTLIKPEDIAEAIPDGALVVSSEHSRLATILDALSGAVVVHGDVVPGADDLFAMYRSAPAMARRDPQPIYLHPAVVA